MRKLIMIFWLSLVALCLVPVAANARGTLQSFEPDSLPHIVEKQKGKPFVLIVWSLDCEFCQASLKTLSELKRKGRDLNVVTISTDPLADAKTTALVKMRLASLGMTGNAWAFGEAPAEQLRYAIDPRWHGEKPRSYWFNARGEKVAYSGVLTATVIDRLSSR